ncbi:MAG: NAD-dependent epimerase/dehydratase family protein [Chloroflexota bacterium]|nr:NAD-dependent epimerase/dehydratase family protein [Chloroflexota bacterium]MDE2910379.1 NAD-dependent epimerase/dehydratase family protein [Chloroflexota bacterium]
MTKRVLIIGGTRNMGYYLSQRLADAGYDLTLLNRGITKDDLPSSIHRLHADRTDHKQMRRALLAKSFDVVIDFVMYRGDEAGTVIELFHDNIDHFIFLSTGQVYLVREGLPRPYREEDYEGRLMPAPKANSYAYEEWRYGVEKRDVEDQLAAAWSRMRFPCTVLRLPMVNSARDPYHRLFNYYLRLRDGGAILVPQTPNHLLNHVYAHDVVDIIMRLIETGQGKGRAYNIAQDERVSHADFLSLLAEIMGTEARSVIAKRSELVVGGFMPDCSPFSERWMSDLDNSRSKAELGVRYKPLPDYLTEIVSYFDTQPIAPPLTYRRRQAELNFAEQMSAEARA